MTIKEIQRLISWDRQKIRRRGSSLILSLLHFLFFIYLVPMGLHSIYDLLPYDNSYKLYTLGTFLAHLITYVLINSMFIFFYLSKFPSIEKYKINSQPWPWETDPNFQKTLKQIIKVAAINQFIVTPLNILITGLFSKFDMTPKVPNFYENLKIFLFCIVCEDFLFYWSHRLLHTSFFYKRVHKLHHEFIVNVSFAAEHAHPFEYIFGNSLPVAMGPLILGQQNVHIITWFSWVIFRTQSTAQNHSGYDLSWNPVKFMPFVGAGTFHDFHHLFNLGNYGSFFMIWDTLFGTQKTFFNMIDSGKIKIE